MGFNRINLKLRYRSSDDNIVKDFYIPVLNMSVLYKRAVGFFSSAALLEVSRGISGLIRNGGRIQLIASPKLQEKDIEAINTGYMARDKVIEKVILDSIQEPTNYFEEERLNLLAHLIADSILDIKIAFFEKKNKIGLYHEKIGLLYDGEGNKIAFTGSLNESLTAFTLNFESIDVFCSWRGNESLERVIEKEKDFEMLWDNKTNEIIVTDFPKVAKEKLESYKKLDVAWDIDEQEYEKETKYFIQNKNYYIKDELASYKISKANFPLIPKSIELYDYQKEAVNNWLENNGVGIFNMATGTGKTYTGLAAIAKLFEKNKRLGVIIVCPYQHLVEQWVEDIIAFNMKPIIGYSASCQKDWKDRLKNDVIDFNLGIINHFCFVTTNATFASDFVQKQITQVINDLVLVIDEAHNFGAYNLSQKLNPQIPYRLALSATIERYGDQEGTAKLFDYFKKECINYPLGRAIKEKKLTPYYYYPVLTCLTENELEEYKKLSVQIAKCIIKRPNGSTELNELGKRLAIKRARLVAGATNKLTKLIEKIKEYKDDKHILVYCGATTIYDIDYVEGQVEQSELRQITIVGNILGNDLGMKVAQFTSQESSAEREILKKEFANGDNIQALIAIRCLDEGVNIPNIKTAFILASSTNPKEYIQRRGRVLRLASGKDFARIYDFITVPRPLEGVRNLSKSEIKYDISLIKKEIVRIEDFAALSLNPQDSYMLIEKMKEVYDLSAKYGGDSYES